MARQMLSMRQVVALLDSDRQITEAELMSAAPHIDPDVLGLLLSVRARMERLHKRERELSGLVSSARELVAVRDVQGVLQKLVDRAQELMGTDIAYLSEYAPATDELFVRATRGTVSDNMRDLRVPAGVGLVSKIVQARRAMWTSDYYGGLRFSHAAEIDAAIEAEQMRSLLGVPLIAGGRVLGVLFAADRSAHDFEDDEIALLSALADHAAVILQSAHLLEAERSAVQVAETAKADAQGRAQAMESSAEVHEQLTRLVLAGEDVGPVARTLARTLGRPVAIANRNLEPLAATGEVPGTWWVDGALPKDAILATEKSRATGRWVPVEECGQGLPDGVVAAMAGSDLLGAVLIGAGARALDEVQQRTVERAAQIVALVTMQHDALAEAEERVRGELVGDLLSGRGDLATLRSRARTRGVELDQEWVAVVAEVEDQQRWTLSRSLSAIDADWLVGHHGRGVVVLVPETAPSEAAERVHLRLRQVTGRAAVVVAAPRAVLPAGLSDEVGPAVACASLLSALGITDAAVTVDAYAPYLAMFGPDAARTLGYVDQTLGPVLAWDQAHGSDLVQTLDTYVAASASVTRAANLLYVHPNTVKQRLERVTKLLGDGWRDPERLFRLGVALRLHALRRTTPD